MIDIEMENGRERQHARQTDEETESETHTERLKLKHHVFSDSENVIEK